MRLILHQRDNLEDHARATPSQPRPSGTRRLANGPPALDPGVVDSRDFVPGRSRPAN